MIFKDLGVQPRETKLAALKFRLYLAMLADVDVDNFPKAIMSTISTNVLLPGAIHFYLDAKINTIKPTGSAGESQGNISLELTPQIEGLSKPSLTWLYSINGERVISIWENCETKQKFIAGSPCSGGLLVSVTSLGIQDGGMMGATLSLKGGECPEPFYFYDGPIIREPAGSVAQDATTIALSSKQQYLLPNNTVNTSLKEITNITDSDVGRIIELVGAGSDKPTTIEPSTKIFLQNGVSWSALSGSKLSLQIIKTGATSYVLSEVYRS